MKRKLAKPIAVIGVDPGITGALALITSNHLVEVRDMPVALVKKGKNEVMAAELARVFDELIDCFENAEEVEYEGNLQVWCEQVHAMPKQGVSSAFGFGRSLGVVEGVVAAFGLPIYFVTPQKWKKHHRLQGTDKDVSRTIASQLYPAVELSRKKDIGRADALLIANYGLSQVLNNVS